MEIVPAVTIRRWRKHAKGFFTHGVKVRQSHERLVPQIPVIRRCGTQGTLQLFAQANLRGWVKRQHLEDAAEQSASRLRTC